MNGSGIAVGEASLKFNMDTVYFILRSAYAIFWIWMVLACVYREEDPDDRILWTGLLVFLGAFLAPVYYFKRYRPMRNARLQRSS